MYTMMIASDVVRSLDGMCTYVVQDQAFPTATYESFSVYSVEIASRRRRFLNTNYTLAYISLYVRGKHATVQIHFIHAIPACHLLGAVQPLLPTQYM